MTPGDTHRAFGFVAFNLLKSRGFYIRYAYTYSLYTMSTEAGKQKSRIIPIIYLLAIGVAELITALVGPQWGFFCHGAIMFILFGHASLIYPTDKDGSFLLMSIALAPLIRIVSLYAPLYQFYFLQWFLILGLPVFFAALLVIAFQKLNEQDIGLVFKLRQIPLHLAVGLSGIPFGILEYFILKPSPLIEELSFRALLAPVIIIFVFTGFTEELLFRGIIQHNAIKYFNPGYGILFTTALFAVMHLGNVSLLDLLLVFFIGYFFSYVVKFTGSIVGTSISHGVTNVFLFLIMPLII